MEPLTLANDRIECFLYLLLRDKLPAGQVEALVRESEKANDATITYSNPHLAKYAQDLAARMSKK